MNKSLDEKEAARDKFESAIAALQKLEGGWVRAAKLVVLVGSVALVPTVSQIQTDAEALKSLAEHIKIGAGEVRDYFKELQL